jgi:hypothetical protein
MADLAYFLLLLNSASVGFVLLREFMRRGGYVTLPFLTALIFLIWYLPQAWALLDFPGIAPESLVRLFLMSLLCFWAMMLGWWKGLRAWRRHVPLAVPVRRLLFPVYVITFVALAMRLLIEMQPPEVRVMGQWTGIITIIAFFASVSVVSMALSTAMVLKSRDPLTVGVFVLNLAIYLPLIFIYFRRADTFDFGLAILLGLMFVRDRFVSRSFLVVLAVLGFFFVNGIGQLRALSGAYTLSAAGMIEARLPTLQEILEIDWLRIVDQDDRVERSEVMNAAVGMEAVARYGQFTLGAQYWNRMIFAYLPGQFVGHDLKQSLMIGDDALSIAREQMFFERHTGAIHTGFLDPYHDFWYLGCLVWLLTGYVMGLLMRHAMNGGLIAFTLYAATITNAIHVTTHFGYYLFSQSLLVLAAILFVRFWLRRTRPSAGH